jgi:uncharacterized protein YkwD
MNVCARPAGLFPQRRLRTVEGSASVVGARCSWCVSRSLILLGLVVAALWSLTSTAAAANAERATIRAVPSLESSVLSEINALRRTHGRAPLRLSVSLSAAAAAHSRSMGARGFFEHASADGTPFWQRIERHYGRRGFSYWAVGENLLWASHGVDAAATLKMWLGSPPHRANLLTPRWREIGLSAVRVPVAPGAFSGLDVTIVTADFGVRR